MLGGRGLIGPSSQPTFLFQGSASWDSHRTNKHPSLLGRGALLSEAGGHRCAAKEIAGATVFLSGSKETMRTHRFIRLKKHELAILTTKPCTLAREAKPVI